MTKHIHQLISLYHAIKTKNLAWQVTHQPQQQAIIHERKIAEQTLAEELTKRNAKLMHEIEMLKTQQDAELRMFKTRCKEDLKDYRQYLQALEQLKLSLKKNYSHLPDALILTIHNHAKNLLNAIWETENPAEKLQLEAQLIRFMTTVHEESLIIDPKSASANIPENTLKLIKQDNRLM